MCRNGEKQKWEMRNGHDDGNGRERSVEFGADELFD